MALILEELDLRHGTVAHRIVVAPGVTIGRAYDSALVVDDPFMDVRHAQVVAMGETLILQDLGSVNGIHVLSGERVPSVELVPEARFHLGRTAFRVVDAEAGLAPAAPLPGDGRPHTTEFTSVLSAKPQWYDKTRWQVMFNLLAMLCFGLYGYVTDATRDVGTTAFGAVLVSAVFIAMGAALWSLIARLVRRPAGFRQQATVIAMFWAVLLIAGVVTGYFDFLFPAAAKASAVISSLIMLPFCAWTLFTMLGIATALSKRRRWIGASAAIGVVMALGAGFSLLKDEGFTDVPVFDKAFHYVPATLIPTEEVEDFGDAMEKVREDVKELVEETRK